MFGEMFQHMCKGVGAMGVVVGRWWYRVFSTADDVQLEKYMAKASARGRRGARFDFFGGSSKSESSFGHLTKPRSGPSFF